MYKCPHCQEESISILKKMFITNRYKYTCPACGGKIGAPEYEFLVNILFSVVIIVAISLFKDKTVEILAVISLLGLRLLLNIMVIPIEKKY